MAESAKAAMKPPCTMPTGLEKRSSATIVHTVRPGWSFSIHTIPRVRSQAGGTCTRRSVAGIGASLGNEGRVEERTEVIEPLFEGVRGQRVAAEQGFKEGE